MKGPRVERIARFKCLMLQQFEKSIAAMSAGLDDDEATRYAALQARQAAVESIEQAISQANS